MSAKTIRMPKELLTNWLAALRSGEYTQAAGTLCEESTGGYCCLGVLQMVADGHVETYGDGEPRALPTRAWTTSHGVEFLGGGFGTDAPMLPSLEQEAHTANDAGVPFADIADAIEACAEGI